MFSFYCSFKDVPWETKWLHRGRPQMPRKKQSRLNASSSPKSWVCFLSQTLHKRFIREKPFSKPIWFCSSNVKSISQIKVLLLTQITQKLCKYKGKKISNKISVVQLKPFITNNEKRNTKLPTIFAFTVIMLMNRLHKQ